jgi:putative transposase
LVKRGRGRFSGVCQFNFETLNKSIEEVIRSICKEEGVRDQELKTGGQRRKITRLRARIACYLSREMGVSMAEIARNVGVGTSAIAMVIRHEEANSKL